MSSWQKRIELDVGGDEGGVLAWRDGGRVGF